METNTDLISDTLDRALIGVSAFFRDAKIFASIRDAVLPELLRSKPSLRVCSAGAADGQELISMAILLAQCDALEGSELLGIDCRPGAIRCAHAGIYTESAIDTLDPQLRQKYFVSERGRWRVKAELHRAMRWQEGDVLTIRDPQPWDMILFRNVAIYLRPEHATHAWASLTDQLAGGGYIVTTPAEKPPPAISLVRVAPAIYRKSNR